MIKFLQILALAFIIFPISAFAETKDSFYFMKDDGIFSSKEKDEEAEYIYAQCARNPFQKIYYDCTCIAGSFRAQRDSEQLVPQSQILGEIFKNPNKECINTTIIAGDSYQDCIDYTNTFTPDKKDSEKYCSCVGNKVAKDFKAKPILRVRYMEKIKTRAMSACRKPYFRQ